MAHQPPLKYVFYIAATPEKVWEGFVSAESNRILFSSADLQADFTPGGSLAWVARDRMASPRLTFAGRSCVSIRQKSSSTPSLWAKMISPHAQPSSFFPRPKPLKLQ